MIDADVEGANQIKLNLSRFEHLCEDSIKS